MRYKGNTTLSKCLRFQVTSKLGMPNSCWIVLIALQIVNSRLTKSFGYRSWNCATVLKWRLRVCVYVRVCRMVARSGARYASCSTWRGRITECLNTPRRYSCSSDDSARCSHQTPDPSSYTAG